MKINGKVHCFFEQSGTFKNEFIKLGIPAEDYDIQNNFGQTDHVTDLFKAIEDAYDGKPSLFDAVTKDVPDYAMVYGVPAEIRGYVCWCGEQLNFSDNGAVCPACGKRYAMEEDGKVKEAD